MRVEELAELGVATREHDAALAGVGRQIEEGVVARVPHDLDAVRTGRQGFLELVDHLVGLPGGILLSQVDAERFRRGARAVGPRQRGAAAGVPAHLEIHHQALADGGGLTLRCGTGREQRARRDGDGA